MTRHREVHYADHHEDFGLSGLAGALCSWTGPRLGVPTVVARAAERACDDGDDQLGRDVRLLLGSPLPGEVLHTVWLAATRGRFDPCGHGLDMRAWLRGIAEACPARTTPRTEAEEAVLAEVAPVVPEEELRVCVSAEIRSAASALTRAAASEDLVPALRQVVEEADADLGFRLFLRALKACAVKVDHDQYERLLGLGDRLAYPLTAVFAGLDVRWPPLDAGRRDFEFGFGLPQLSRMFDGEWDAWRYEGTGTPREQVVRLAHADSGMTPGSQAAVLLQDVRCLLNSALSDDEVTALWRTAARRRHRSEAFDADGRAWLREIAEVCTERLAEVAPAYTPVAQEQTGTSVDADLGFRLLLRILDAYGIPAERVEELLRHG
ncbi:MULTISPECIES: hypothetical protein [unclassified Streptomyces]|uniref:hypothetical protein n=1 Tax=unclassified Streptomyces TaxID=2593676 RepID=UPI0023670A82|nr:MULTISPECIES: hypothetical protein [unclassified Streptomyces]MDF3145451.1 hypothetical protein [Streptomyces sp. T21Q-yed]WDF38725.1 hypothetical protein PBV52_18965 [Streptomyces sp. T12]